MGDPPGGLKIVFFDLIFEPPFERIFVDFGPPRDPKNRSKIHKNRSWKPSFGRSLRCSALFTNLGAFLAIFGGSGPSFLLAGAVFSTLLLKIDVFAAGVDFLVCLTSF